MNPCVCSVIGLSIGLLLPTTTLGDLSKTMSGTYVAWLENIAIDSGNTCLLKSSDNKTLTNQRNVFPLTMKISQEETRWFPRYGLEFSHDRTTYRVQTDYRLDGSFGYDVLRLENNEVARYKFFFPLAQILRPSSATTSTTVFNDSLQASWRYVGEEDSFHHSWLQLHLDGSSPLLIAQRSQFPQAWSATKDETLVVCLPCASVTLHFTDKNLSVKNVTASPCNVESIINPQETVETWWSLVLGNSPAL